MCCFSDFLLWFAISQIFPHFPALRLGTAKIGKNRQTEKLSPKKGPPSAMNGRQLRQLFRTKTTSVQMLDAAHGAGRNPVAPGERMCTIRSTGKETGMQVARNPRRRSPHVAAHVDFRQGSRVTVAVARSRRFGAIARRNAAEGEQNNSEFTTLRLSESKDRSRALPSRSDDGASRESFRTCSSMTEAQPIQGTAKVKPP